MRTIKKKIGFIGCGNMGSAILGGLVRGQVVKARSIIVHDSDPLKLRHLRARYGVTVARSNNDVLAQADIIILAVKPQTLKDLGLSLKRQDKVVVSILAGTTIETLTKTLGTTRIVRTMPNLGATLGIGITAVAASRGVSKTALALVRTIFQACGAVVSVPERLMNAVTAISGSGPAYYFYLSEVLEKAACRHGLSKAIAAALVVKTAAAASAMMLVAHGSPSVLRAKVTSKKGTTEAALKTFKKMGFERTVDAAIKAAIKRGQQLSQ